jgi:hypothetical protein
MKRFNFKLMAVLAMFAFAVISAEAQTTPEAVIGNTPGLPSAKTLAANSSDNKSAQLQVRAFVKKINEIDSVYTKSITPEVSDADVEQAIKQGNAYAEKQAQDGLGKSVDELKNMSEAEIEALAMQKTNEKISSLGMGNLSLDQMQNMSEDQLMAAMGANMGLTPDEMKAMQHMSEKEVEAYMKQGDRMQRVQNSQGAKAAQKQAGKQPKVNPDDVLAMQKAAEDQQVYMQRFNDMQKLIESERVELAKQFAAKEERTQRAIASSEAGKIASDCSEKTSYTNAQCETAWATVKARWQACHEECFTIWCNQIVKEQGRIKALLPEARRMDELNVKARQAQARLQPDLTNSLTQKTQAMPVNSASLVSYYLTVTASAVSYPVDR